MLDARRALHDIDGLVAWHEGWDVAANAVSRWSPSEVNVPDEDFDGPWLADLALSQGAGVVVRAPLAVARRYEPTDVDLRLQTAGGAAMMFGHDDWALLGGTDPQGPVGALRSPLAVRALRQLITPEQ